MTKEQKQIKLLEDCTVTESRIECSGCPRKEYLNELDPEQDACIRGWRVEGDDCHCPTCVKLYKKKSKNKKA